MGRVTEEQVKHVAKLARLELTEKETTLFTKQLDDIMGFANKLNEVDTSNVAATTHVLKLKNVMREDKVRPSLNQKDVFKNVADHEDGQFKVPSILE